MKKNYYELLGLERTASQADIKKAFQKLASKHHPDKVEGEDAKKKATAQFQEVKEAYEVLHDPVKRAHYDSGGRSPGPSWTDSDGSMDDMVSAFMRQAANGFHSFKQRREHHFNGKVTLADAYRGFETEVVLNDGSKHMVKVAPGTPHGYRTVLHVNESTCIVVTTVIIDRFKMKDPMTCEVDRVTVDGQHTRRIHIGDIEMDVELHAASLIIGSWINVTDFMGETYEVRVPAGFNPKHRLKVKGKGYVNWLHDLNKAETTRADLFVRVVPTFERLDDVDPGVLERLAAASSEALAKHLNQE